MTKAQQRAAELAEAQEHLRQILDGIEWISTECVSWSRSGMSRDYRVFAADRHGEICPIAGYVADACGFRKVYRDGGRVAIRLGGCGFSGDDEIREEIARVLGRAIKNREL